MTDDDILDDLFLGCALAAFIDQAIEQQGPPDMEATRRRAYRLYESELASKNADRPKASCGLTVSGIPKTGRQTA